MPLFFFTKEPGSKSKYDSMFMGFPENTTREQATEYANRYFEGNYICQKPEQNVNPPKALCLQESKAEAVAGAEKLDVGEDDQFGRDEGFEPLKG